MAGRPQRVASRGTDAIARIRAALVDGSLAPGERIRETDLAQRFGMSRTPVREAIHRLRVKGLISHQDGALVITRLSRRQIDEIYAMRETLEGMAARLAAINAKPQDIEDLSILISSEATAVSAHGRARINTKFHSLLAVLADNAYLSLAIEDLSDTLTLLGLTTLLDETRFAEARSEHESIVAAIAAGDAEAAEARIRFHLQGAWKVRRKMMLKETKGDSDIGAGY